jgi:formate-dependent nitrite reductase cytochrome c552 subunit
MLYRCMECAATWTSRSIQEARENKILAPGWWRGMLPDVGPIVVERSA